MGETVIETCTSISNFLRMPLADVLSCLISGETLPMRERESVRREICFSDATAAHHAWMRSLASIVANPPSDLDPRIIEDDRVCLVGRWIHGEGKRRYGTLASFRRLTALHQDVHALAGQVLAELRANHRDEATELFYGELRYASTELVMHLRHLDHLFKS